MKNKINKFRFWDHIEKTWVVESWIKENLEEVYFNWLTLNNIPKEISVNQFARLKDKNDKDIYEGDIVKADHSHPNIQDGFPPCVVKFGASRTEASDVMGFYCEPHKYGGDTDTHCYLFDERVEVIGNIYEKP